MKRIRTSALLCALLLAAGTVAAAEAPAAATPATPLTLEECVRRALAKNFNIEIGRFATANARESLVSAEASFDPTLQASASKSGSRSESSGTVNSGLSTRLSASQRLATGATVNLGTNLNRSTSSVFAGYNPSYGSDLSLSLTQPLLQGAGSGVNRAGIRKARIGVERSDIEFRGMLMDVVQDTENAFYQLFFARQQLEVRRLSLTAAQKLHEENKYRLEVGALTPLEVLTAEVGVANQQRNVLLAQQQVRDREDALRALIGQFELDAPVETTRFPDPSLEALNVDSTFERAKSTQPEYLSAKAAIEQVRIDIVVARNDRLPSLDLNTSLGYNTDRSHLGAALREVPGSDGYNWQVGLALTYPWGRRGDQARYRQAQNNLLRETTRLRQTEQNLLVLSRSAVRAVETNREAVQVSSLAARLSEKQFDFEKARLDNGQTTSRRVLEAQADLDSARVNELSSKVSLLQSLASLRRLEGRTLDAYEVKTP